MISGSQYCPVAPLSCTKRSPLCSAASTKRRGCRQLARGARRRSSATRVGATSDAIRRQSRDPRAGSRLGPNAPTSAAQSPQVSVTAAASPDRARSRPPTSRLSAGSAPVARLDRVAGGRSRCRPRARAPSASANRKRGAIRMVHGRVGSSSAMASRYAPCAISMRAMLKRIAGSAATCSAAFGRPLGLGEPPIRFRRAVRARSTRSAYCGLSLERLPECARRASSFCPASRGNPKL